jgi:phospholipid-translocating ATPase
MIQTAHIGVGIEGNEGNQAAVFADFSVQEFQGLRRLILWHGRSFGLQAFTSFLPGYIMKGHIFMAANFWSNWMNGFSGMPVFKLLYDMMFDVLNTNFNAMAFQIFTVNGKYEKDMQFRGDSKEKIKKKEALTF